MDDLFFALFKLLDDWSPFFRSEPDEPRQILDVQQEPVDAEAFRQAIQEDARPLVVSRRPAPTRR